MRRLDRRVVACAADEQGGEPLVELLVGDRFDDAEQRGEALPEQREHVLAERGVVGDERAEVRRWQHRDLEVGLGRPAGRVLHATEQARRAQHAGIARAEAVELHFASVRVVLRDAQRPRQHQRESAAGLVLAEHDGTCGHAPELAVARDALERAVARGRERRERSPDPVGEGGGIAHRRVDPAAARGSEPGILARRCPPRPERTSFGARRPGASTRSAPCVT